MRTVQVALLVHGLKSATPEIPSHLARLGCVSITSTDSPDVASVVFELPSHALGRALVGAVNRLERQAGVHVVGLEPSDVVGLGAIAARTGRTRESVRLLAEGRRGPGGFPAPIARLDSRTRVWSWLEVAAWLKLITAMPDHADEAYESEVTYETAKTLAGLQALLRARQLLAGQDLLSEQFLNPRPETAGRGQGTGRAPRPARGERP